MNAQHLELDLKGYTIFLLVNLFIINNFKHIFFLPQSASLTLMTLIFSIKFQQKKYSVSVDAVTGNPFERTFYVIFFP